MWAQLITMRLKPGKGDDLPELTSRLQAAEKPGSGLIRSTTMRDQNDPSRVCTLVVFESEEHARARENDPTRADQLASIRDLMADMFDGPPEFIDLDVVSEH